MLEATFYSRQNILVQEDREDCLRFDGILAEKVLLLDVVRPLFSRQRFPAVCHIADILATL